MLKLSSITDPPQSQWNVPGAQAVVKGAATLGGEWKAVEEASAAARLASRSSRRAGYISFTFAVQLHWLAIRGLAPHYVIMCFDIPTDMV